MYKNNFISIIIPNHNKSTFIVETLNSIKNQTYKNWEAIIIDDNSTDNSVDLIKKFQLKCSNVKLILNSKKKEGASFCRNIGVDNAIGNLIMFLDSDDLLMPNCLSTRIKSFLLYPDHDFIVFPTGTFFKKIGDSSSIWLPKSKNFLISFLKHNLKWTIMSTIWKKSSLKMLNGFDEEYSRLQDVELHTRALLNPDFRYKVLSNNPIDNYYRIDVSRTSISIVKQLENFQSGIFMFISKTFPMLEKEKQRKALKVSLLSLMNSINYATVKSDISIKTYNRFDKDIKSYMCMNEKIFSKKYIFFKYL